LTSFNIVVNGKLQRNAADDNAWQTFYAGLPTVRELTLDYKNATANSLGPLKNIKPSGDAQSGDRLVLPCLEVLNLEKVHIDDSEWLTTAYSAVQGREAAGSPRLQRLHLPFRPAHPVFYEGLMDLAEELVLHV
jgi:hypothetical protein